MIGVAFYVLAFGVVGSGIMVVSALNPVHSIFWLIVVFAGSAIFFLLLGIDFVALMFLIIYVGAIAILFLFVIMLLDLTDFPPAFRLGGEADMTNYVPIGLIIGTFFFSEVASSRLVVGGPYAHPAFFGAEIRRVLELVPSWSLMKYHNMEALGRILYIACYYLFILASLILLVAMIGAIVLTQEIGSEVGPMAKRQEIFFQTSR
uniref:NADH-ubiquinone oxidoreductase chain 6 n=3 Tax=Micrabaciidae TaxID=703474 RepID=A0A7T6Y8N5_9CNID|nr:NADH dehydrogenase subunit 6 [Letepsammia formosissima]QQK55196.1 NADH dehydrogenase subunit 6 [Rhombopsammia niphada]QQK55209.1 NADH dehydrogenase subunit 6 [Letepsammia superstes]